MLYDRELRFLCEVFKKSMVPTVIVSSSNVETDILEQNFKLFFLNGTTNSLNLNNLKHNTIYRINNSFGLNCIVLRLPDTSTNSLLLIGPYLSNEYNKKQLLEIAEQNAVSPSQLKLLERFYENISIILDNSHLFVMLDTFAEHIWGKNKFEISTINNKSLIDKKETDIVFLRNKDDVLLDMKLMEERYAAENEMINAISSGQKHKGLRLLADFSNMPFEKRLDDPLRNLKNYSIIMNTLLRKAAEKGGVHPLYIDRLSSDFATKIERSPSVKHLQNLMLEMYNSYCLLVQKHKTSNYSAVVRKALLMIDADISSELSLCKLAKAQNINASYLSSVFKKETGHTITEHIKTKRIQLALQLLETTSLQIQTVALHCGIMDVQYFSKLFKKHVGSTPKEYRETAKKKSLSQ